jgi:hypothetical protein
MGETDIDDNDTCCRCGGLLDPDRDHHVALSRTSVDLRTASKETDERLVCLDCTASYLDADARRTADSEPVGE